MEMPYIVLMCFVEINDKDIILGLSTSCSRFPEKWPAASSQKVAQKRSKVAFVTKVAHKLLQKKYI